MNGNKQSLEELITHLNTTQLSEHTGDRTYSLSSARRGELVIWIIT